VVEIRQPVEGEAARFRELRLRALKDAPFAFGSSFERERRLSLSEWEAVALGSGWGHSVGVVFVAVGGDVWLGMAGGFLREHDLGVAVLWGLWVSPVARRQGLGRQLAEAVVDWARAAGAPRLELSVTDRADAAMALYTELGLEPTGEQRPLEKDPSITELFLARPI
jgi:GNAT superfamily N-acetyltransferase